MFECYAVSIDMAKAMRKALAVLRTRDRSLAEQLQRACASVALNVAEGRARTGRDRTHLFRVALGSARECVAALEVAQALGLVAAKDAAEALALLDRVGAMLWRLTEGRA